MIIVLAIHALQKSLMSCDEEMIWLGKNQCIATQLVSISRGRCRHVIIITYVSMIDKKTL